MGRRLISARRPPEFIKEACRRPRPAGRTAGAAGLRRARHRPAYCARQALNGVGLGFCAPACLLPPGSSHPREGIAYPLVGTIFSWVKGTKKKLSRTIYVLDKKNAPWTQEKWVFRAYKSHCCRLKGSKIGKSFLKRWHSLFVTVVAHLRLCNYAYTMHTMVCTQNTHTQIHIRGVIMPLNATSVHCVHSWCTH